jgi:hypothetical protein
VSVFRISIFWEGDFMTKTSTAIVFLSGKSFGPLGSPGWRTSGFVELIEGGGSGPFLMFSSTECSSLAERSVVLMPNQSARTLAKAFLIAAAGMVGGSNCSEVLRQLPSHSEGETEMVFEDADFLNHTQTAELARELTAQVKLGVVILEADTVLNDEVLEFLRNAGIETSVFTQ